jgi:hypothetical protein
VTKAVQRVVSKSKIQLLSNLYASWVAWSAFNLCMNWHGQANLRMEKSRLFPHFLSWELLNVVKVGGCLGGWVDGWMWCVYIRLSGRSHLIPHELTILTSTVSTILAHISRKRNHDFITKIVYCMSDLFSCIYLAQIHTHMYTHTRAHTHTHTHILVRKISLFK